jgi:hypothetical protein
MSRTICRLALGPRLVLERATLTFTSAPLFLSIATFATTPALRFLLRLSYFKQNAMSAAQPYFVSDEDDVTSNDSDGGLELLDYGKA